MEPTTEIDELVPAAEIPPHSGSATATPGTTLPVSSGSNVCSSCRARLAPDQRYCVECGERCGEHRVPFLDARRPRPLPESTPSPARRRGPRLSPNGALIAGVGTLILALGTGVLIGRTGNGGSTRASAPAQVVTVSGAGSSGTTGAGAATSAAAASSGKAGSHATKGKKSGHHASSSKQAASGSGVPKPPAKLPPPTVTVGSPGHGPGYRHGKFTGDFFGP